MAEPSTDIANLKRKIPVGGLTKAEALDLRLDYGRRGCEGEPVPVVRAVPEEEGTWRVERVT